MRETGKERREREDKLEKIMEEIVEKYKDKKLLYKKMNRTLRRFKYCYPINHELYKEVADLTKKINFACNFKAGLCKAGRSEMCCCKNCEHYFGHFDTIFFSIYNNEEYIEKEMLYYAKKYRISTGFWRKDKGCILPRDRRSSTCLLYNCSSNLTNEEKLVLDILRNFTTKPSYIHRLIKILKDYFLYRE